jgi:putative flippase GtrA
LVGGITVAIDWLIFVNLYVRIESVALANLISGAFSASFNYFAHHHWTFKSSQDHKQTGIRYIISLFFGYLLNTALLKTFIVAGILAGVAKIMATGIQAGASYVVLKSFVFRRGKWSRRLQKEDHV